MSSELPNSVLEAFPPVPKAMRLVHALCGLGCAGLILVALALARAPHETAPGPEIYVAHQVSVPLDEPPPPHETPPTDLGPVVGPMRLEIAAAATSNLHIQVPDMPLLTNDTPPPPARAAVAARFDLARSSKRPAQDDGDLLRRRVFSRNEVDQRPIALQKVSPNLRSDQVSKLATPRVLLLLVVNTDGSVGDVRTMHSSQDENFDQAVIEAIREWRFSPAIRKGQKVRCWVEQAVNVKMSSGSPFEVN